MTHKASKGPQRTIQDKYGIASFVNAVIDANGDWIEMPQDDVGATRLASLVRNAVLMRIGTTVSEVSARNGVVYARMRKST